MVRRLGVLDQVIFCAGSLFSGFPAQNTGSNARSAIPYKIPRSFLIVVTEKLWIWWMCYLWKIQVVEPNRDSV